MAYVSHVPTSCLTGSSQPPRSEERLLGFIVRDLLWRPLLDGIFCGGNGRDRAPSGAVGGGSFAMCSFKRRKEGERPRLPFPIPAPPCQTSSCVLHLLLPLCFFIFAGADHLSTGNRASMASSGAWMGSCVNGAELGRLHPRRFPGSKEEVGVRAPGPDEISPDPREKEFVVFSSHLARGWGCRQAPSSSSS